MNDAPGEHSPLGQRRADGCAAPTSSPLANRSRLATADPVRALLRVADRRAPDASLLRDALRCALSEFGAAFGLLRATLQGTSVDEYVHSGQHDPAFWREPAGKALAQSIALGQSVDIRYRARNQPVRLAVVAAPIGDADGDALGAISLVLEIADDHEIERARIELRAFAATLWLLMRARPTAAPAPSAAAADVRATSIAGSATSVVGVAIGLTNQLRAKIGCEQVALGTVRRRRVRLLAISGFADVNARTPGCIAIQGAMEECFDLDRAISFSTGSTEGDGCPLHRHWSAESEGACVATVPIQDPTSKATVAILALRHVLGKRFQPEELKKIGDGMVAYPAALRVAELAHRSVLAHAIDSFGKHVLGLGHARGLLRFATTAIVASVLLWVAFGSMRHSISANARIAPTLIQHLTAPFDGRIGTATVREGDRVRAGDTLVTLDTSALDVERARLEAAVRSAEIEAEAARAKGDHAMAKLVLARCEVDRASLRSVERRIFEALVRAPADGFILRGDLRDRVGATVATGASLLEFVPSGSLRLLLDINERDVLHVAVGEAVEFRPHARPDITLRLSLERVHPAGEVRGSENIFTAEAPLETVEPWMLAGVEGAARIVGDPEPVWWVLFHRMIDAARLRLWM